MSITWTIYATDDAETWAMDSVQMQVIATTEAEAIDKAKKIYKKKAYIIKSIKEQ